MATKERYETVRKTDHFEIVECNFLCVAFPINIVWMVDVNFFPTLIESAVFIFSKDVQMGTRGIEVWREIFDQESKISSKLIRILQSYIENFLQFLLFHKLQLKLCVCFCMRVYSMDLCNKSISWLFHFWIIHFISFSQLLLWTRSSLFFSFTCLYFASR